MLITIVYPAATGLLLGLFYYGSLWLVVRRLPRARRPGLVLLLSFPTRAFVVVFTLYLLFAGSSAQLLAALAGMLVARMALAQRIGGTSRDGGALPHRST